MTAASLDAPPFAPVAVDSTAVIEALVHVFARWQFTRHDAARTLGIAPRTWDRWRGESPPSTLPVDTIERAGHLIAIDLAVGALFGDGERDAPHPLERAGTGPDGVTPAVAWLRSGSTTDLYRVRVALEAALGGPAILARPS